MTAASRVSDATRPTITGVGIQEDAVVLRHDLQTYLDFFFYLPHFFRGIIYPLPYVLMGDTLLCVEVLDDWTDFWSEQRDPTTIHYVWTLDPPTPA